MEVSDISTYLSRVNAKGETDKRDGGNSSIEENQSYTRNGPWQRIFESIIPTDVQCNSAERRRFNEAIKNAKADMETSFDFSKKWSSYNKADQGQAVETFRRNLALSMKYK